MAQFTVRVHGLGGVKDMEIEAGSQEEAQAKAARHGKVLVVKRRRQFNRGGLSFTERQVFFSRLAAMLASGVGTGEALRLIRDTFTGRIKRVAHQILLKIESGQDLSVAIDNVGPPDFPENVSALIKAGSAGGSTHEAIKEAMNFEREMIRIKKGASKGLGGAISSLIMAALLNIGSIFYMMPKVMGSDMIKMMSKSVDIEWVIDLANWFGYSMVAILVIGILLFFIGTVVKRVLPQVADAIIMRIPIYKDLMLAQKHYIALFGMSLLVRTGVRMEHALDLTSVATPPGALKRDLIKGRDAVRKGRPWAIEMKTLHETDRAALSASLDREQVSRALTAIADQYRDLYADQIAMFVPAMQGLAALFMMLSGVIMFGVTILPMLQATQGAFQ